MWNDLRTDWWKGKKVVNMIYKTTQTSVYTYG